MKRPKKDRPFLRRIGTFVRNLFEGAANVAVIVKWGPASLAAILAMLAAAWAAWRMMR